MRTFFRYILSCFLSQKDSVTTYPIRLSHILTDVTINFFFNMLAFTWW